LYDDNTYLQQLLTGTHQLTHPTQLLENKPQFNYVFYGKVIITNAHFNLLKSSYDKILTPSWTEENDKVNQLNWHCT